MSKIVFAFSCILLCYSLTNAAKQQSNEGLKTKEVSTGKTTEDEETVDLMAIMLQCNEIYKIEDEYLIALNHSGSFPDETERTPKCFIRCLLEKTGVATQEGTYNPQVAAMVFGWERSKATNQAEEMATACTENREEKCKCERAYQYLKCFMEKEVQDYEKSM